MKKFFAMSGIVASLLLMVSASAFAEWSICTPTGMGASADLNRLQVSGCDAGNNGWLTLDPTAADRQMATVLTAISLGKQVSIETDGSVDSGSIPYAKYVILYTN